MEEFILNLIKSISGPQGYLLLGISAFFENVLPPIPGDTVTLEVYRDGHNKIVTAKLEEAPKE